MATWETAANSLRVWFAVVGFVAEPFGRWTLRGIAPNEMPQPSLPDAVPPIDRHKEIGNWWMRYSHLDGGARLLDLTTGRSECRGLIVIQVFSPLGTGTKLTRDVVDAAVFVYQRKKLGDVFCGDVEHDVIGATGTGGRANWQENVRIPFRFEHTPA